MLAKDHRLRRAREIQAVYRQGAQARGAFFTIKARPNRLGVSRVVVVISTKVSKKAVVRNRLRRQITAQLRALWPQVTPGLDMVVTVHSDGSQLPTPELKASLLSCLRDLKALH